MIAHFIFTSSSYSKGERIALDNIISKDIDKKDLHVILKKITDKCGEDVSISTHLIHTEDESWKSVQDIDHFFKNVKLIKNVDDFIDLINLDREIKGIDVAKYILSKVECTQLKLQKLVYLCYADYLCKYKKQMFKDKIFAFQYGPVVLSIYDKYKKYGYKFIDNKEEQGREILKNEKIEMPSRSRIMFAKDGLQIIQSIDETLRKYSMLTASRLVTLTHKDNTPWTKTYNTSPKGEIIDEVIIKYHRNEEIA